MTEGRKSGFDISINLINTAALARWLALTSGHNRFNGLLGKPLKTTQITALPVALIFRRLSRSFGLLVGCILMKTYTLRLVLALGFLVYASRTATAQQLPTAPIVIQLSEIDRYAVKVHSLTKATGGAMLILPYRDMKHSEVDTLVRNGMSLHRSVWVMEGAKVIAKCRLMGEYDHQPDPISNAKYGLCLGFDSAGEAQKVGAIVTLRPALDELIRQQKSQLNDERFWIF